MAEINISTLSDFVKNADILFAKGKDSVSQSMRSSGLVKEISIPKNSGNTREFTEIDLEEYASKKGEGDQAKRAKTQQGYSKIGTLYRLAKDISITYEMRTQGKYMEITNKLTSLGRLGINRMDLDLSHRFGFGTATTYTDLDGEVVNIAVGDTLSLFNTAHTLKGSSSTYRNRLASNPQLSRSALEAMEKMRVENCLNQFGEKMSIRDNVLWTTDDPNTIYTAREILRSTAKQDGTNSGVYNAMSGRYTHVILPRVATTATGGVDSSKAKYWGTANTTYSSLMLGVAEEPHLKKPPVEGSSAEEFSTDDFSFGVRGGWMIVTLNGAWVGFSSGDAA